MQFTLARLMVGVTVFAAVLSLGKTIDLGQLGTCIAATGAFGLALFAKRNDIKPILTCAFFAALVGFIGAGVRDPPWPEAGVAGAIVGGLLGSGRARAGGKDGKRR